MRPSWFLRLLTLKMARVLKTVKMLTTLWQAYLEGDGCDEEEGADLQDDPNKISPARGVFAQT